jgi:outer membrane protein assembly factor BamB
VPTTGVSAVVLSVTVTGPAKAGSISAYPHGSPRPPTSSLNFVAGQTVPNLVIVRVGTDGAIDLHNASIGTVHLIADITGYYMGGTASTPGAFAPMTGSRLLDTRVGTGAPARLVAANGTLALQVTGRAGVPTTGVSAVVLNVTVTSPAKAGWISAYPHASALPSTSNLNFAAGQTVPNLVIVPVGANGAVDLHNGSGGTVHLVADVTGYYHGLAGELANSPGRSLQGNIGHSGVLTGVGLSPPLIPAWATGGFIHPNQVVLGAGAVYVLGGDASSTEPMITALRESDGSTLWGPLHVGNGGEGLAYDAGRVFAVDQACHLHAYDATSGTPLWTTTYVNDGCYDAPTAANGIVYFGTFTQLIAVSESTGSILWIAPAWSQSSSPAVGNGKVIVDPTDLLVSAFAATSGAPAWHYAGLGEGGGGRLVAIAGGRVYARSTSSSMTKIFNADTGVEVGTLASDGPPAVDADKHVIITQKQSGPFVGCGGNPCSLVARSLDTGAALWSFKGDDLVGPPLIVDGVVYVASFRGNIYGLDEMTGALVWSTTVHDYIQPFDEHNPGGSVALNAADGLLIVSSEGGVHAFKTSSSADVAPIQHFYFGMVQSDCSESPNPSTVPSCTWNTTQTYAGVDVMHLIFDPAYKATLTVDFLDSAGDTLATVTTQSGDAYLTSPSLPAGGTYQVRVRGAATPIAPFKLYFAEAQPHIGAGPAASFSATALPFAPLPVGSRLSKSLIIRNTGDRNLKVGNTALVGPGAAAFSVDFNSCDGADLPAGSACTLVISAHPGTQTSSTAKLTVPYGASSQSINLSVTGY